MEVPDFGYANSADLIRELNRFRENEPLIKMVVDDVRNKYWDFKLGEDANKILLALDFQSSAVENSADSRNSLQLIVPTPIFQTVSYDVLFPRLMQVFFPDFKTLRSKEPSAGTMTLQVDPRDLTHELKDFMKANPGRKIDADFKVIDLQNFRREKRRALLSQIYKDSTGDPLTLVLEVFRTDYQPKQEPKPDN